MDRFHHERTLAARGCEVIAGVDEAGRGPLAGPVVAAAVILPGHWITSGLPTELDGLNDSKQVPESRRLRYFRYLTLHPEVAWGIADAGSELIDRINILQATHEAMKGALLRLPIRPGHVLVDGRSVPSLIDPHTALVKGDSRSYSIAAASILAKVSRDQWMVEADRNWPGYGFAIHKGYPTPEHLAALRRLGPCPIHRRSFAPLRPVQPSLFPI